MRVLALKNLNHQKSHIVYIRKFDCEVVLELPTTTEAAPLHFEIELDCFGNRTVRLNFLAPVNYPLLPLKKSVTEYIKSQDEEGNLPC